MQIAIFSVRNDPLPVARELAVLEFVGFPPSLEPLRMNAEVRVGAGEPARVEAGFGCEGVADLVLNLGGRQCMHSSLDEEATAKAVYAALLGVPPQTDGAYYVGFQAEGQHIGLVPGRGPQGMTSPVAYWHVPDLEAKLAGVTAADATAKEHDIGGGSPVATVTGPDCNVLGLLQDR